MIAYMIARDSDDKLSYCLYKTLKEVKERGLAPQNSTYHIVKVKVVGKYPYMGIVESLDKVIVMKHYRND